VGLALFVLEWSVAATLLGDAETGRGRRRRRRGGARLSHRASAYRELQRPENDFEPEQESTLGLVDLDHPHRRDCSQLVEVANPSSPILACIRIEPSKRAASEIAGSSASTSGEMKRSRSGSPRSTTGNAEV
jgi:hypothetical protein